MDSSEQVFCKMALLVKCTVHAQHAQHAQHVHAVLELWRIYAALWNRRLPLYYYI